ncbi:MAG: hypothetical protein LBB23_03760 [Rickettsiales bacterium]|jgi:hypothetical protein|nr:hypothetical protein [Rickettsiales bacterium]
MNTRIKLFEDKNIRTLWDDKAEKWYFSVVDVVGVLTDQPTQDGARNYWKVLKHRLNEEGSQLVTNCNQLKMQSSDGKFYLTDAADAEQILRLVQSIPSKKAEPFKLWLAKVGSERLDEIADPELAINRALETYARKGYSLDWINQRLKTIEVRKLMTDEWDKGGITKGREYAILTDEIYKGWAGLSTRDYKRLKGLTKANLRDNMSNLELVLNMLAEATTTEIAQKKNPQGLNENMDVAREGSQAAGLARKHIEKQTGAPIITGQNAKSLKKIANK